MRNETISVLMIFLVVSAVGTTAANGDAYFESKFDGVWAGYLELEGMEFPLLLNFNAQKAASAGFLFFLALGNNDDVFDFKPFPISGVKLRPTNAAINFIIKVK